MVSSLKKKKKEAEIVDERSYREVTPSCSLLNYVFNFKATVVLHCTLQITLDSFWFYIHYVMQCKETLNVQML